MIAKEMDKILAFDHKMQRESKREHTEGCCIIHLSPDYIFKLRATMTSVTEREKRASMYTGKIIQLANFFRYYSFKILSQSYFHFKLVVWLAS
jgi:hypothetical protein